MRSGAGWTAVTLADVEALPWEGTELEWRPLRSALGVRFAGAAAFTASRAGQEVVEDHAEDAEGRGHQELYVVLGGAARFELDGTALDAAAGTFVRVDPGVRRSARAQEPGTAVLVLGGPETFVPSASEWIERVRAAGPDGAAAVLADLRRELPASPGVAIAEALVANPRGRQDAARAILGELLAREPELAAPLARDPQLGALVGAPADPGGAADASDAAAGADVRIRRARPEDLADLLALHAQLRGEPARAPGPELAAALERILAQPRRALLVAELDGAIVGSVDVVIVPDLIDSGWATIENVVVDEARRRRGVGSALLDAAVALARSAGCVDVQLVSHERRREAHELYAAAGFDVPVRGFRRRL